MTIATNECVEFSGYTVGQQLAYLDRSVDDPGQVTVRTGIVAGACVDGELLPMVEADASQPGSSQLVAVADLIGVLPSNRHLTERKPRNLLRSLSRIGRHRK